MSLMRARREPLMGAFWQLPKATVRNFVADESFSRGAAIAYYTVFAIAPLLVIVIAAAGLVFGRQSAQGAIVGELASMLGAQGAQGLQALLAGAYNPTSGVIAAVLGAVTLFVAAGSVFGELQAALNRIWKAEPPPISVPEIVRIRAISFGLVLAVGFLSLVSLLVSTAIAAADRYLNRFFVGADLLFEGLDFVASLAIMTLMFATIYRVLPDKRIAWRDVLIGAAATSLLFSSGKWLISVYLGSRFVTRVYGAAGGVVVILVWIYFAAQIFLFGAEFARTYAERTSADRSSFPPQKSI